MGNEALGIIATLFILLAFLQDGELQIRLLDSVGALLFVIYGVLIHSFSTVLLNAILIIIQSVKLYKYYNRGGHIRCKSQ